MWNNKASNRLLFISDTHDLSTAVTVTDNVSRDSTVFEIAFQPLDKLDCDLLIVDLCYWPSANYKIYENTKPSLIGSLSSPYLMELCKGFKIDYMLVKGTWFNFNWQDNAQVLCVCDALLVLHQFKTFSLFFVRISIFFCVLFDNDKLSQASRKQQTNLRLLHSLINIAMCWKLHNLL